MMDYREYLRQRRLILELTKDADKPLHVVQSRNQLLKIARGSIRQHLQRQILEALNKNRETMAPKPGEII